MVVALLKRILNCCISMAFSPRVILNNLVFKAYDVAFYSKELVHDEWVRESYKAVSGLGLRVIYLTSSKELAGPDIKMVPVRGLCFLRCNYLITAVSGIPSFVKLLVAPYPEPPL